MRRTIKGFVTAALLGAVVAAPAGATVRERIIIGDTEWAYVEDCGFPVEVAGTGSERILIREGKNRDAGAFPVLARFRYRETWTNPATGEWFVVRGRATFNEVGATRVRGSIFEFRTVEAGQPFVIEDSDGNVVSRNRGSVHIRYLFDTEGDDEPGGFWVADVDLWIAGPHPGFDTHPCDYAGELIG